MAVVCEIIDLLVCRKIHGCGCVGPSLTWKKYFFSLDYYHPTYMFPHIKKPLVRLLLKLAHGPA
jgi:hypothetical protein